MDKLSKNELTLDKTGTRQMKNKLRCPKCGSINLEEQGRVLRCKDCGAIVWEKTKKRTS